MEATALAHSNIALIKYWGKRHTGLNLPAVGSISITLHELATQTKVSFDPNLKKDMLLLNSKEAEPNQVRRVAQFLDLLRLKSDFKFFARIDTENNFPTGAGLASSASAFAALALAASRAAGLQFSAKELSLLARLGSGSAARSIYGGFVEMHRGEAADGMDSYAEQLANKDYWDLRVLIAVTSETEKKIGSRDGMTLTKDTSPYYQSWIDHSEEDLKEMRRAIHDKDFQKLGELSEFSCLKMHALALAGNPGLIYWQGATIEGLHLIRDLRKEGQAVYFTIDAGPQLKAICLPEDVEAVASALKQLAGIRRIIHSKLGDDAHLVKD